MSTITAAATTSRRFPVFQALAIILVSFSAASSVLAADEDPLQDFCVADPNAAVTLNGRTCKPVANVIAQDFASTLLRNPGTFNAALGSAVNLASVATFPGLNTQGLSIARIDFRPKGVNPPHVHPRATEVLFVVQGTLTVGFVTALAANNTLFQQTLYAGDLFVFPRGLVHFQINTDNNKPAVAIAALNSQNPGVSQLAAALFAVNPPLPSRVIQTAFGINEAEVERLIASVGTVV